MNEQQSTEGQTLPDEQELQAIETQLLEGMALSAHGGDKLMRLIRHLQQERAKYESLIRAAEAYRAVSTVPYLGVTEDGTDLYWVQRDAEDELLDIARTESAGDRGEVPGEVDNAIRMD